MNYFNDIAPVMERFEILINELWPSMDPQDFWATDNLWRYAIVCAGIVAIEYYPAILREIHHHSPGPAAALSRSLGEASIRLDYLSKNEGELSDFTVLALKQDLLLYAHQQKYDGDIRPDPRGLRRQAVAILESLLEKSPKRPVASMKAPAILEAIFESNPDYYRRFRRWFIHEPSAAVHSGASLYRSNSDWVRTISNSVAYSIVEDAMRLSVEKCLLSAGSMETAVEIRNEARTLAGVPWNISQ